MTMSCDSVFSAVEVRVSMHFRKFVKVLELFISVSNQVKVYVNMQLLHVCCHFNLTYSVWYVICELEKQL